MLTKKDAEIISHLRNNARKRVTIIAKNINMPLTTVYDKIRAHEKKFIKKHITLLDFQKMGLNAKAHITIKVKRGARDGLQEFLMKHPNINSLCKVNSGSDYFAEVVFRNFSDIEDFVKNLEKNYNAKTQIFNIIEELKKEAFLTKPEHFKVI